MTGVHLVGLVPLADPNILDPLVGLRLLRRAPEELLESSANHRPKFYPQHGEIGLARNERARGSPGQAAPSRFRRGRRRDPGRPLSRRGGPRPRGTRSDAGRLALDPSGPEARRAARAGPRRTGLRALGRPRRARLPDSGRHLSGAARRPAGARARSSSPRTASRPGCSATGCGSWPKAGSSPR